MATSIPQETIDELVHMLSNLVSNDNTVRTTAEQQLNNEWMATRPDTLLAGLAHLTCHYEFAVLRSFAAVLTRRVALKTAPKQPTSAAQDKDSGEEPTLLDIIPEETRQSIKTNLITALQKEDTKSARNKICDTIAEIARVAALKEESKSPLPFVPSTTTTILWDFFEFWTCQPWPELLPVLLNCATSTSAEQRESAFRIFTSVPHLAQGQQVENLSTVFSNCLKDPDSQVRLACLKAVVSIMLDSSNNVRNAMGALLPQLLEVLSGFTTAGEEDHLVDGLVALIELAEHSSRLFRGLVPNVLAFMIEIVKKKDFEDRIRQSALELLLTLAECSPALVRKVENYASTIVPVALEMMTEIEDEKEWYACDGSEEDDNDANYILGEHALDRLARALGGKTILPVSFTYIPQMLESESWQARHSSLMAISAIAEGCARIMEEKLLRIVTMVLPFLTDSHPRVRFAACNTVGQLSTDFAGILQKNHHSLVLKHLIPVMDDAQFPRVRAHAAAALVNFCEAVEKTTLEPYLDSIFERLLSLLNSGSIFLQEQAITTIAMVADSAEERFVKYYNNIMPLLINVLQQATSPEYRLLRGKTMECASLIALAVGKNVFAPHAQGFIKLLVQTQASVREADDPQVYYLLTAWARICKVLGQDFVPYLDIVMPPLLASAQLKPDFAVVDPEDDVESKYSAEDGWEFVGVDGQQIGIKTTVLEEKCTAVEMLSCYAQELGSGFRPYLEKVRDIVLPLLRFYFHDGVRHAAVAALSPLILCLKQSELGPEYTFDFWHKVCAGILEVIATEADPTLLVPLYEAFYEGLGAMGPGPSLTLELLEGFSKATEAQLREFYARLKFREEARVSEELEAEDVELIQEEEMNEEAVLGEIGRAVQGVFKTHGVSYLPIFHNSLEPLVAAFLSDLQAPACRQWAICVLGDLVEFTGPNSWPVVGLYVAKVMDALLDPSLAEVRQAACYTLGICGQYGGPEYGQVCAASLPLLFQLINVPGSRSDENVLVTENAIAAVTKICLYNAAHFDINAVLPSWTQSLPVLHDPEEAPIVYKYLLDLLDAQHPAVLGLNNLNLAHLTTVMIETLVSGILTEPTLVSRMAQMLKACLNQLDVNIQTTVWNSVSAEKRKILQDMNFL
ncbi:hypothetical protein BGZ94_000530 [Podila epigama]|nr:hypothetical protein BGZ94_000530 [Podila epigama]